MLTLNDGRKQLYQWDIGRTAIVNIDCDAVHFSHLNYGESLVVDVKDGTVNIPNQLLISSAPIYCWAFAKDESGAYTKQEQTFEVIKRAKPSDYVYTETEVLTLQTAIENAIQKAVESGDFDGEDGLTPYIKNNYWYIGEENTGVIAKGIDGKDGVDGISPVLESNTIDGATQIIVTDKNGRREIARLYNGKDGKNGEDGKDGVSPALTTEAITNGYNIIIRDVNGVKTITLYNGQKGDKGNTGNGILSISLTKTEGLVDTYTITFTNGDTTTFTVTNGAPGKQGIQGIPGEKGADGYTPVKGKDYFTPTDIAEIVNEVYSKVADGNEVAY